MDWTVDDLFKAVEKLGDAGHNAGVAVQRLFVGLNRFNRRVAYETKIWRIGWELLSHPNNRRKMSGKPLIRRQAYKKAYRNERKGE